jgi:hypothetical protein
VTLRRAVRTVQGWLLAAPVRRVLEVAENTGVPSRLLPVIDLMVAAKAATTFRPPLDKAS